MGLAPNASTTRNERDESRPGGRWAHSGWVQCCSEDSSQRHLPHRRPRPESPFSGRGDSVRTWRESRGTDADLRLPPHAAKFQREGRNIEAFKRRLEELRFDAAADVPCTQKYAGRLEGPA